MTRFGGFFYGDFMLEIIALGFALAAVEQSVPSNCGYPCNHYIHAAEGAALGAAISKFYGEETAWKVGIGFAVGAELVGRLKGKSIRMDDIATRSLGVGAGIWFSRSF